MSDRGSGVRSESETQTRAPAIRQSTWQGRPEPRPLLLMRTGTMTDSPATRPFRFGVVAPLTTDLPTWRDMGVRLPAAPCLEHRVGSALAVGAHRRPLRDGHRHWQARNRGRTSRTGT